MCDLTCEDHHDAEGHQEDLIECHHSGEDNDNISLSHFLSHNLIDVLMLGNSNLRIFLDWNSTRDISILAPHQEFWPAISILSIIFILAGN